MSESEAKHLRLIRRWINTAENDYKACRALQDLAGCPFRQQIGFLAQQSAEKYIKTWLELGKVTYPYTHDISRLLDILEENGNGELAKQLDAAETLTPYAVQFRYPFEGLDLDDDDIRETIEIASEVRRILRDALGMKISHLYGADESEDVQKAYGELDLWRNQK